MPACDYFTIDWIQTTPQGGGPEQTFLFTVACVPNTDFKGIVTLEYELADNGGTGNVEQVAGVDLPPYVFLYYEDSENVTVVVSNIPQGGQFNLTLKGTSGSFYCQDTGPGLGVV